MDLMLVNAVSTKISNANTSIPSSCIRQLIVNLCNHSSLKYLFYNNEVSPVILYILWSRIHNHNSTTNAWHSTMIACAILLDKFHNDYDEPILFRQFASSDLLIEGQRCVYSLLDFKLHVTMEEFVSTKQMLWDSSFEIPTQIQVKEERWQVVQHKKKRLMQEDLLHCYDSITGL